MKAIGYFKDGPWHEHHMQVHGERSLRVAQPVQAWEFAKEPFPLNVTAQYGEYERDVDPKFESTDKELYVFVYRWKGWQ